MKLALVSYFIISTFLSSAQNSKDQNIRFEKRAKARLQELLKDKSYKPFYDILIKNKETAVAVAEPMLFSIYGKKEIIGERPYKIALIDGYWYMNGTLPDGMLGGGFEMVIKAKDGQVIFLYHYK